MTKKLLAAFCASLMVLTVCTGCGKKDKKDGESSKADSSAADSASDSSAASAESEPDRNIPEGVEEKAVAQSGDAVLLIADKDWYVKYFGTEDDLLTYGAGIAHISGDGSYTVSVNAGSKGTRYSIMGDPEKAYQCSGLGFAAVKVFDGTTLYPNMSIEIKEIRVDGKAIPMTAKNYTNSDDNTEMRANIYNEFVSHFPEDAHTSLGALTGDFGAYSSQIVDLANFDKWEKVEVDFIVRGTGTGSAPAEEPAAAPAAQADAPAAQADAPAAQAEVPAAQAEAPAAQADAPAAQAEAPAAQADAPAAQADAPAAQADAPADTPAE